MPKSTPRSVRLPAMLTRKGGQWFLVLPVTALRLAIRRESARVKGVRRASAGEHHA